jgi:hypothetical protein
MILLAVFEDFSYGRLSVLFILLFWMPLLILHELGHAAAAKMLGWQVREIVIGFGQELWRWQFGETRVRVKLAPVEGYVLPAPRSAELIRMKSMLIYAAGPGAELLLLGAMLIVLGPHYVFGASDDAAQVATQSLAIAILIGAGFNLLPFRTDGGISDGLGIITSPFMSGEAIHLRLLAPDLAEMGRLLDAGETEPALEACHRLLNRFPTNLVLPVFYATALAADRQYEAARQFVREQLAKTGGDPRRQLAWLQRQARIELEAEAPSWLVFDLAVQKAAALAPASLETQALQGMAMVLRGHAKDGGDRLADVWRRNRGELGDAELLAYLTIAAHRVGHQDACARFKAVFDQINTATRLSDLLARGTR